MRIGDDVAVDLAVERRQRDAARLRRAVRGSRQRECALAQFFFPSRRRHDLINEPPVERAAAARALLRRAEHIGEIATDPPLVGHAREPAGTGQHPEERHFRQRDRRATVVDQHDPVASQCQLVAAAGGGAVDRREIALSGMLGRVLDRETRLVGKFAEIDLVRVRGLGERADIGAGAEHIVLARADHDAPHLRMLKA